VLGSARDPVLAMTTDDRRGAGPGEDASDASRYVLGSSRAELERLERQHAVWSDPMADWLDTLALEPGATVVDAGCGPGAAIADLVARVGPSGTVVGVDRSDEAIAALRARVATHGWTNVRTIVGDLERASLVGAGVEDGAADAVVLRWVLSFPRRPERLLEACARWLAPGGRILVVDYDHDGVAVFPRSAGFEAVVRAVRALYRSQGGDPWIAGRLPALFDATGFELDAFDPRVLAGAPGDAVWSWVGDFLALHAEELVAGGFLARDEHDAFTREWAERSADPFARLVSPIVVGATATRRE